MNSETTKKRARGNTGNQTRNKPQRPGAKRKLKSKPSPSSSKQKTRKNAKPKPKRVKFDLRDKPAFKKPLPREEESNQPPLILKQQEPVVVEDVQVEESISRKGLERTDKLVIYTLWSSEILFILIHAFTHRIVEDVSRHEYSEHESHGGLLHDALLTCSTCVVMLLVGLFGDYFGRRFLILISGLSVFSLSPVVGILSLHIGGLPIMLMWLTLFWYATVPCRLWLVYHQKFPLPIHDTHITVTINELLIEVSEWLSVVFIEGSKVNYSYPVYLTVWTLTLCAAIGQTVATYFIRNVMNKQPSDFEFVRGVYQTTEVIDSFENRQAKVSVMVFLLILYTGGIFTVAKEYLAVSILQLSTKVYYPTFGGIVQYRLDLIISVVTMSVVEVQLSHLKSLRGEVKDLILITIAHVVNIAVLVLLLIAVSKSERGYLATEELNFGSLEFFYPLHYHPFFLQCDRETIESNENLTVGFGLVVNGRREVVCRGWKSDDDVLFYENVTLRENLRTVYLIRKPKLLRVDSFDTWKSVSVTNIVLMNSIDFCSNEPKNLNLSNLCSLQSVCLPLQVEMIARSVENSTLFARKIHLPHVNKSSDFISLPKITAKIEMRFNYTVEELRKSMNVTEGKFLNPLSWPLHNSFSIDPDPTIIVLFFFTIPRITCVPLVIAKSLKTFYPDTEMIAPAVLMGIVLGIAAVGYIHFMWTQSPVRWRTSIIAVYFVQHLLFTWIARTCLLVNVVTATSVLVIQCISSFAHVAFTYWFRRRLPPVHQEHLKQKGGQRF